ncbi:MAG: hypothetical protein J6B26_01495 [Agathobacter sp.]|nr:hypothetical protein [Agathobacter sp.]MBP3568127.1 hypothetical protein [Lachnospiraceae bacterium]
MENDREIDQVLMNINKTAGGVVSAALFSVSMSFKLLQFLLRLAKKGMVATGLADSFKDFTVKTEGEFSVYNIPLNQERVKLVQQMNHLQLELQNEKNPIKAASIRNEIKKIEQEIPEIAQLKDLGIQSCLLPKLNGSDQTIQIAVARKDDQLFKSWFLNHLTTELTGGEKNLEAIKVFTEGNYTILNMPFEEKEELGVMLSDFESIGVNYSILPDLKVGDGYTQLAMPNADRDKVEMWFKMWKDKQLAAGLEVKEMYSLDENSYTSMAAVTGEEYIASSDQAYQAVNDAFEAQSREVDINAGFGKENSAEYVRLMSNQNYSSIGIDKRTLVEGVPQELAKEMDKRGYFVSRIPGSNEHLIIPKNRVFEVNDGRTYLAFLNKTEDVVVVGQKGAASRRSYEDIKPIYDKVQKNSDKIQYIKEGQGVEKAHTIEKIKDQVVKPKAPKL